MRNLHATVRSILVLLPAIVAVAVLGGCANIFQETYVDRLGQPVSAVPGLEPYAGAPRLIRSANVPDDVRRLVEDGYVMIGYSRFNSEPVDAAQALQWGQKLHAEIVLLGQVYTNTEIDAMPVTYWNPPLSVTQYYWDRGRGGVGPRTYITPRTTVVEGGSATTYVPLAVNRYNYDASYWVKEKSPVLGARVYDLTPALRLQLQRNTGAVVYAVVKGSPAWDVGLLEGDVITQLGTRTVSDAAGLQAAAQALAGRKVDIKIIRGGRERTLTVTLRPGTAPPATAPTVSATGP